MDRDGGHVLRGCGRISDLEIAGPRSLRLPDQQCRHLASQQHSENHGSGAVRALQCPFQGRVLPDAEAAAAHQRPRTHRQFLIRSHPHHLSWQRPLWFDEGGGRSADQVYGQGIWAAQDSCQCRRSGRRRVKTWRNTGGRTAACATCSSAMVCRRATTSPGLTSRKRWRGSWRLRGFGCTPARPDAHSKYVERPRASARAALERMNR
jgi:hypothetical protein